MSLTSAVKKETNVYELEVAVGADELVKAADIVFKRRVKTINVPGFRKGKAPRKIIEKMYGEGVFLEDAVNDLYPAAYDEAVTEAGIDPVDRASIEVLTLDKETGFTFKATVTVKPEMSLTGYKGVEAEKKTYTITEADIDAEIGKLQDRGARSVTVEDRAAKDGDTVVIDFEGFVDDVAFEGGKGEGYRLTLGSHSFIDTFEQQIEGHNTGDEFDVNVKFPDEYHSEELKGKPALFKVKLVEITAKELPELDDEFAKDVSEFDTLAELREDIRKKEQEKRDAKNNELFENALLDKVIENLEGEIPEIMYENRIDGLMREFEYRLQSQGMRLDIYLQYTGMDMESFRKTFREQAEKHVKISLALEKIAELEEIKATEEDITAEYAKIAEAYGMELDKVKGIMPESDIMHDICSNKAIDLIKESAKITETAETAADA